MHAEHAAMLLAATPVRRNSVSSFSHRSNRELGLGARTTRIRRIRMSHEFDLLGLLKRKHLLEPLANLQQHSLALGGRLRDSRSGFSSWNGLSGTARPETDAVESFADVDDYTHDFVVGVVFELLADGCQEHVQPDVVVGFALLKGVGPAATVLVLRVFPFGAHAFLEEVVVGFLGELGGGRDVVLCRGVLVEDGIDGEEEKSYVDAPEFLDAVEADDFLQQLVPVLLFGRLVVVWSCVARCRDNTFPLGGLVNHRVQVWANGCLTLKLSGSWKTVTMSPEEAAVAPLVLSSPSGEMGIVLRSTGDCATSAMFAEMMVVE